MVYYRAEARRNIIRSGSRANCELRLSSLLNNIVTIEFVTIEKG